jgi:hypothetical protein
MQRMAVLLTMAALLASCGSGEAATTTSAPTTTTAPPPPSTTTTSLPVPEFAVLGATVGALEGIPDGPILLSGIGRRLGTAFDDVGGGIVFEQLVDGVWQTWHLEAGRREPIELGIPGARLGDVGFLSDRPVTAALWSEDAIVLQVVKGGAPDVLVAGDLPIGDGDISGVTLGDTLLAVATVADDCHDVTILTITGELVSGPFGLCGATPPSITGDGSLLVYLDVGASTRVVFADPTTGEEVARQQVDDEVFALAAGPSAAVVTRPDGVDEVTPDGVSDSLAWDPRGVPIGATPLRAPLVVSDLATLGGDEIPADCSASGLPELAPQSGLSPDADRRRNLIVAAATDCDYLRLAAYAAPDFDGPDDLVLALARAEADGIPAMGDIVRTLGLPHAANGATPDIEFVWPSILGDEPTDEDWAALRLVYNEERIEEWRTGRGPFDGMSITITEAGLWTELGGLGGP